MSVDTTLRVMRVFLVWTPTGFILEHVELEYLNASCIEIVQVFMKGFKVHQTIWHIVVFYT